MRIAEADVASRVFVRWPVFALLALAACRPADNRVQLLELPVTDMQHAVRFYQAVFGWEVSHPDSAYAILAAEPVAIGLRLRDSVTSGGSAIVIAVPELEVILARVVSSGGAIRAPIGPSWQGRQFRLADPDGNELVVWSDRAGAAR